MPNLRLVLALFMTGAIGCGETQMVENPPDGIQPEDATVPAQDGAAQGDAGPPPPMPLDAGFPQDAGDEAHGRQEALDAALSVLETGSEAEVAVLVEQGVQGVGDDAVIAVEGWPFSDGERLLFVHRVRAGEVPHSVVGDFNGWRVDEDRVNVSHGVAYVLVAVTGDPSGQKYKWYFDGDYRAPEESRFYDYDEFGEVGYVAPPTAAPFYARFLDLESPHLPVARSVRLRLPAGFSERDAGTFRTLLLHDGQNVFGPDAFFGGWRVDEALASDTYLDVVAVAVDNAADRMSAYTHTPDSIGSGTTGGNAEGYAGFLVETVLPLVRRRFGIAAEGQSLMISGSSLGGLVSLYLAVSRPTLAHCVAALSSTLGWGAFATSNPDNDALIHRFLAAGHQSTAIYLDSGGQVSGTCGDFDGDGVYEDSDHSDNYCTTLQLRDALSGLGYQFGVDLFHYWEPGAAHNEAAWRARFPGALGACSDAGWSAP